MVLKMSDIIFPYFNRIYYEEISEKYPLGKMLLNKYKSIEKYKNLYFFVWKYTKIICKATGLFRRKIIKLKNILSNIF